jgi:flagellar FliL protein
MAEHAKPAEDAEAAPVKKSRKKLFIIIGALLLVLGGGGAGAWFLTQGSSHATGEVKVEPPKIPVFLPLDTFTVNLQGGERYLQTEITLQFDDQEQVDVFKTQMPRVRSRMLALLSGKHAEDLASTEDKKKLAQEIKAQLNQPFYPKGKPQQVVDVLFTAFVIQ